MHNRQCLFVAETCKGLLASIEASNFRASILVTGSALNLLFAKTSRKAVYTDSGAQGAARPRTGPSPPVKIQTEDSRISFSPCTADQGHDIEEVRLGKTPLSCPP